MPYSGSLPRTNAALVDGRGFITREWLNFLAGLAGETDVTALASALVAVTQRVAALEQDDAGSFAIQGIGSISVSGTPQNGVVQISLYGDTSAPGVNYVYGTGPDGSKGWHRLYDAIEAGVGLVITDSSYVVLGEVATPGDLPGSGNSGEAWRVLDVDPGLYAWDGSAFTLDPAADGTVGFRLAELADSSTGTLRGITRDAYGRVSGTTDATITGTAGQIEVANGDAAAGPPTLSLADVADAGGGTLQRTAFDAKGRKTGTSAATTDDLTEGAANLYFTDERADARITLQKGQPLGLATLDADSKLDAGQLPALAITETFVVADEAAMLALDCQQGDVAVRMDESTSYILTAEPASVLANWQELLVPTGGVTSFNGRTGSVVPATGDYTFAQIDATPTTLAGYGITDAALDSNVVHKTGAEAVDGAKTFLQPLTVSVMGGYGYVAVSSDVGQIGDLVWQSNEVSRWALRCTNATETGGNTGSNLTLQARSDGGTNLHNVFDVERATGVLNFPGPEPTIGGNAIWRDGAPVDSPTFTGTATGVRFTVPVADAAFPYEATRANLIVGAKFTRTGTGASVARFEASGSGATVAVGDGGDNTLTVKANTVNIKNLPTSAAGLSTGDLWNDAGTLKIAP